MTRYRAEVNAAVARVIESSCYIRGKEVESFEHEFADYCGIDHCIGVGSGTDALALALRALGIRAGDEVLTTALTAPATAHAIAQTGAVPRFVDVDPVTRCIDPSAACAAITQKTRAIVPVHLFGASCDMNALMDLARRHRLFVVEDCAQSHGATLLGRKLGSFGHAAAYSFYPTKNLGGIGDGGAVVTTDAAIAEEVRSLANYGFGSTDRISRKLGVNSRLDEMQAAILRALLSHLDEQIAERRAIAARYRRRLDGVIECPADIPGCVYHQFAVTSDDRDRLARHLADAGVSTAVHYSPALHQHPAFAADATAHLPKTEKLAATLLSLPIQPEVASRAVDRIAASIAGFPAQWAA